MKSNKVKTKSNKKKATTLKPAIKVNLLQCQLDDLKFRVLDQFNDSDMIKFMVNNLKSDINYLNSDLIALKRDLKFDKKLKDDVRIKTTTIRITRNKSILLQHSKILKHLTSALALLEKLNYS